MGWTRDKLPRQQRQLEDFEGLIILSSSNLNNNNNKERKTAATSPQSPSINNSYIGLYNPL